MMNRDEQEQRLADEFRTLRSDVEAGGRVPDFDSMLAGARAEAAGDADASLAPIVLADARRRRRAVRVGGWASLATAAAAVGLLLVAGPVAGPVDSADAEFERLVAAYSTDRASGGWTSPTASLLDTPGVDLGAVPSIGGVLRGLRPETVNPAGRDS